jgi:hypothetical protein
LKGSLVSTTFAQKQPRKNVNEAEQPHEKDESIPFVLPFDSQDVTPSSYDLSPFDIRKLLKYVEPCYC